MTPFVRRNRDLVLKALPKEATEARAALKALTDELAWYANQETKRDEPSGERDMSYFGLGDGPT